MILCRIGPNVFALGRENRMMIHQINPANCPMSHDVCFVASRARARPPRPSVCLKSSAVRMLASLPRIRHLSRSLIRLLRRPFFALPVRRRGERPPTPRGSLEPQLLGASPQYKMIRIFIAKISLVSYFSLPSPLQPNPNPKVESRSGEYGQHMWLDFPPYFGSSGASKTISSFSVPPPFSLAPILRCIGHITTPPIRHDENPGWRMGGRVNGRGTSAPDCLLAPSAPSCSSWRRSGPEDRFWRIFIHLAIEEERERRRNGPFDRFV